MEDTDSHKPNNTTRHAELDALHLEYEALLVDEIESLIGIASVHGWQSKNVIAGAKIRAKLRSAGSNIVVPESDACLMASLSNASQS